VIIVVDCDSFCAEDEEIVKEEEHAAITRVIHENKLSALVQNGRLRVCLIALSAKGGSSCSLLRMPVINEGKGEVADQVSCKVKRKGVVTVSGGESGDATLFTLKAALGAVDARAWLVSGDDNDNHDSDVQNCAGDGVFLHACPHPDFNNNIVRTHSCFCVLQQHHPPMPPEKLQTT